MSAATVLAILFGFVVFLVLLAGVGYLAWLLTALNRNVQKLSVAAGSLPDTGVFISALRRIPDLLRTSEENTKVLTDLNVNLTRFLSFAFSPQNTPPAPATMGEGSAVFPYNEEAARAHELTMEAQLKKYTMEPEAAARVSSEESQ